MNDDIYSVCVCDEKNVSTEERESGLFSSPEEFSTETLITYDVLLLNTVVLIN
jgi:hypothetical protein